MAKSSQVIHIAHRMKKEGIKVQAVKGWHERGRPYTYSPIGAMFHHTASAATGGPHPALGTVTVGRSDLPGPLCQFLVARDAVVYAVAAGYANHAGLGGPWGTIPLNSGNRYLVGFECENNGVGEDWPHKQKEVIATCAALCLDEFGHKPFYFMGHKEYTSRKIDPAGIIMPSFRRKQVKPELKRIRKEG